MIWVPSHVIWDPITLLPQVVLSSLSRDIGQAFRRSRDCPQVNGPIVGLDLDHTPITVEASPCEDVTV